MHNETNIRLHQPFKQLDHSQIDIDISDHDLSQSKMIKKPGKTSQKNNTLYQQIDDHNNSMSPQILQIDNAAVSPKIQLELVKRPSFDKVEFKVKPRRTSSLKCFEEQDQLDNMISDFGKMNIISPYMTLPAPGKL